MLLLFKILGRSHRSLHLWDLFDTYTAHEATDQREIRHLIHPVPCNYKSDRGIARVMGRLMRSETTTKRRRAYEKVSVSGSIKIRSSRDSKNMIHTARLNWLLGGQKTFADIWTREHMKITLTLPHVASGNGTKTTGSLL